MLLDYFILEADRHHSTYICKECQEPHHFNYWASQTEIDRELTAHHKIHQIARAA